jgi:K+-transporting ATPase A subunit
MALGLARIVRALAGLIALIIVVAIVLFVLGANQSNGIVSAIHDAGAWLVGPFKNLFSIHKPKLAMAVNWGLAALVYLIVGHFIASLLVRMTPRRRAVAV